MEENRRFTRIVFSIPVEIQNDTSKWTTQLIDLSLKGALVEMPPQWEQNIGGKFSLCFNLAGSDIGIKMNVHEVHQQGDHLGFSCDSIDLDSASHLRRLIELNVGNADLLNRELEHLVHPKQQ